jgi:predicted nucleic acid-binding protein
MIAICDQGPLHYLILIGCDHVLPRLYERVIAPRVVVDKEMGDPATPEPVRTWAANPPQWLEILEPREVEDIPPLSGRGDRGAGEIAAIALARELGTEDLVILMDDKRARREARTRGLHPVWTLTVLDEAAERGLIPDITERLEHLEQKTPFRINRECKAAIEGMKQRALERRQAQERDRKAQEPDTQSLPEAQQGPAPEPPSSG